LSESAIRLDGLCKRYDDVVALDGLSLEVARGECFALLGPNGAGKTTTVEILQGISPSDGGEATILGLTWDSDAERLRSCLGVQLQEARFPERLTVRETLVLFRSFYPSGLEPDELIRLVSLQEKADVWVKKLSGGQRQRLSVACALAGDPQLLFLDEPTTGLDPQSRLQVWDVIETMRARGRTILLTTHHMDEAEKLCDRVAIIDHGRRIALGTPRELVASLEAEHVIEFDTDGPLPLADVEALPGVSSARASGESFHVTCDGLHRLLPVLLELTRGNGVSMTRLATHHASLEDVFVSLTGRHLRDE